MSIFIKQFLEMSATLYILGFLFVLIMVASGYEGGDMLSEHYKSVMQFFINLI